MTGSAIPLDFSETHVIVILILLILIMVIIMIVMITMLIHKMIIKISHCDAHLRDYLCDGQDWDNNHDDDD